MNLRTNYISIAFAVAAVSLPGYRASAQDQKLSLQDAVTFTLENNPELKASQLEVDKSRQGRVIARSLYLPSVNATAFANHYFQRTVFFGFGENSAGGKIGYGRFGGEDQGGAAITAIQPLFNPVASPSVKRSKVQEQGAHAMLDGRKTNIIAEVKQTYLQLLVLKERINLQEQSIQRNQRVLKDSRSLLIQGKALRVDTLRAYTAVKNLEPELLKLSYAIETAKLRLKALLGIDSLQNLELTDSLVIPTPSTIPAESEVYEAARKNNASYRLLALQEEVNEYDARQASAARLPVLSLVGQYQVQTQTNNFEYSNAYYPSSSFVGLQLTVPLFTGLSNHARVKQAQFSQEQSSIRLKDEYEKLKADVHATVASANESLARIHTTSVVKETAKLSFDITQYRYARGVASRLELTDAELALTQAQSNYLEAVYDYMSARIDLFRLMGQVE